MKCLLLNDTRSDNHIGCELVVRHTLQQCRKNGLEVVASIPTSRAQEAPELIRNHLERVDMVLLNGEGTLHDDKPNAMALLEAAEVARAAGLKVVLYNALWSNNRRAVDRLGCFDLVFCRDRDSATELKAQCPAAVVTVVPDMTFLTEPPSGPVHQERQGVVVTDSVRKAQSVSLARYALSNGCDFSPMSDGFFRKIRRKPLLRWSLRRKLGVVRGRYDSPERFLLRIRSAEGVVTGRFHAACLSLVCGTPVCCLASNTRKIQSLYADFGLDRSSVFSELGSPQEVEAQWKEQRNKAGSIERHVARARGEIAAMFEAIAGL
jgi:polysaccharide pyruvyl transferase WcaK-like protein